MPAKCKDGEMAVPDELLFEGRGGERIGLHRESPFLDDMKLIKEKKQRIKAAEGLPVDDEMWWKLEWPYNTMHLGS